MKEFFPYTLILAALLMVGQLAGQCHQYVHSNADNDGWLSCEKQPNPNPAYPNTHWIQYDFGHVYSLGNTYVWNYNDANFLNGGFKEVSIDYSLDGLTWDYLGEFQFAKATGSNFYGGFQGPNFEGVNARYVLLTALSTWGNGDCAGIAEVQFNLWGSPTSVEDLELTTGNLILYPNPVADQLTVRAELAEMTNIELLSLSGQRLAAWEMAPTTKATLDLSKFPTGFYLVRATSAEGVLTRKLVIE
ncbi:MAG: T9SS type A sorting domain-containing protein [Phaeodactylibacter sp.]|nr:T9SS type A sorting domain-containing protein [Phaeodactylibacter sp.]